MRMSKISVKISEVKRMRLSLMKIYNLGGKTNSSFLKGVRCKYRFHNKGTFIEVRSGTTGADEWLRESLNVAGQKARDGKKCGHGQGCTLGEEYQAVVRLEARLLTS